MLFVTVAQTLEDLDRFGLGRRFDHDHLEAAIQGDVLLDVFAILVERGGADALDLAASQGRLEHVRGVDRPFGSARSDQGVQFVDEQNRVLGPADFVHDRLDPLFELTAILGAGDHHRQIQDDDPSIGQQLGNVALDHALGKALDDGGFADAGFAQQDGVVLRAAAENLDRPLDFFFASDDRVELALAGQLGQVAAETIEGRGFRFAALGGFAAGAGAATFGAAPFGSFGTFDAVAQQVEDFFADFFQLQTQIHQHLGGDAFLLAEQAEQDVLGADIVVVEVAGLFHRVLDDLFGPRRLRQLAHRDHVGSALDELFDFEADLAQIDVEVFQDVGGDAAAFLDQPQQDVLGANVFVVKALRFLVGQLHDLAGAVGESFVHISVLSLKAVSGGILPRLFRRARQVALFEYISIKGLRYVLVSLFPLDRASRAAAGSR